MRKLFIKHDNLRKSLEILHDDAANISDADMEKFIRELKHSILIIAADICESSVNFTTVEYDGKDYGLLFTDMNEFRKLFSDDNQESHEFDFHIYQSIVKGNMLEGFLLNPASEGFLLKKELFLRIEDLPNHEFEAEEVFTTNELKNLKESINNSDLEEFIRDSSNIGKYEELFEKMSHSTLLTLMISDVDLREFAKDGVISLMETGPMGFLYIDEIGGSYATVYTSENKISNVHTPLNKYSQIVNFSQMTNFILSDDMDGIIINPGSDNILLTRDTLMQYYGLLEKTCNDTRLNTAIMHMFLMEEAYEFQNPVEYSGNCQ